jgi:hypothetical protein
MLWNNTWNVRPSFARDVHAPPCGSWAVVASRMQPSYQWPCASWESSTCVGDPQQWRLIAKFEPRRSSWVLLVSRRTAATLCSLERFRRVVWTAAAAADRRSSGTRGPKNRNANSRCKQSRESNVTSLSFIRVKEWCPPKGTNG